MPRISVQRELVCSISRLCICLHHQRGSDWTKQINKKKHPRTTGNTQVIKRDDFECIHTRARRSGEAAVSGVKTIIPDKCVLICPYVRDGKMCKAARSCVGAVACPVSSVSLERGTMSAIVAVFAHAVLTYTRYGQVIGRRVNAPIHTSGIVRGFNKKKKKEEGERKTNTTDVLSPPLIGRALI